MNKIKIKIFILFLIFGISVFAFNFQKKPITAKILKVIEADEYYIDLNHNNKIDDFEHVKIRHIHAIKTTHSNSNSTNETIGINKLDYLKTGYIAKQWAVENLENKNIAIYGYNNCKNNKICNIEAYINNKNIAQILLENGLAYPKNNPSARKYFKFFTTKQVKDNALKISKLDFVIIDLKTSTIHKTNCKLLKKIEDTEIVLLKDIEYLKEYFCKICNKETNKKKEYKIPKSRHSYKKTVCKNFQNIDICLINPLENKKPNINPANAFSDRLIYEILSAKETIHIALYGISEQPEIINALKLAKEKGVKISIVTDTTNAYPNTKELLKTFDLTCNKREGIMHNKFFIFDKKLVLSGSTNISPSGSGGYNNNLAIFINNEQISKIYLEEFENLKNNYTGKKEKVKSLTDDKIRVYFSPHDDIYTNAILSNLKNAKKNIYISAFYLTDKNLINSLIEAKKQGVEILVLLDATSANNFKKRVAILRNNGIATIVENWGGKNHEKTIVIDDKILITGSANFSKNAFYKNSENIVVIKDKEIASWYSDYFLHLFNSIDKKYLKLIPRAEGFDSINSCYDGIDNNFDGKIDSDDEGCKIKVNSL